MIADPESLLRNTPYLIEADGPAVARFQQMLARGDELAERASRVGNRIKEEASEIFNAFGITLRSELVAESNRMEHLEWTPDEVRAAVLENRDLLDLDVHLFLEALKGDPRAFQALGLYRAQEIADEWARAGNRPREFEIRELHRLITFGEAHAGRYKAGSNKISGASHTPPAPADAADGMRSLAEWLQQGSGHPSLDATVVHAWLAHLHPFDDGNGRLARLLANLALTQSGYPPLILQPDSDRGEYYDALAASDEGDILPLLELFTRVMRRTIKAMSSSGYVEQVIKDRMLVTRDQRHDFWERLAREFEDKLQMALKEHGLKVVHQGLPNASSFRELADRSPDGNSWFLKIVDAGDAPQWLLWFGYNSESCVFDNNGSPTGYPSIFASIRDHSTGAKHPYSPDHSGSLREIVLTPGRNRAAAMLTEGSWADYTVSDAAKNAARLLALDA